MLKTRLLLAAFALIVSVSATSIHADVVVFQENFTGLASNGLSGTTPTTGTGTWLADGGFNADGSISLGGNRSASFNIGSTINAAKGSADGLFELTATLAHPDAGSWYSLGFSQQTAPAVDNHFLNRDGLGSIILRTSGELDMWAGNGFTPNGLNPSGNSNAIDGPNGTAGPRTLTVEMDLRAWDGITNFGTVTYFDSGIAGSLGTFSYTNASAVANGPAATDPNFNSILLSGSSNTVGAYSNLTLTQITAVPEPGSLAILGLGSLVMVTRRRKSKS